MPLITCREVQDKSVIKQVIHSLHTYQWLIFTSKNGVDFFFNS
ncbi:uroporphyrinogen-III synthase [Anaerobacillus sp. HL2]|nr:uroporphyrinogen-III synthase [Anaerobacillus sp. HL2]